MYQVVLRNEIMAIVTRKDMERIAFPWRPRALCTGGKSSPAEAEDTGLQEELLL